MNQNQDPYVAFTYAKGNAVSAVTAWLGSVLGPLCIFLGWGKYNEWPLYVGIGLTFFVLISIKNGSKALSKGVRSDFVVYSVFPILILVVTVVFVWVCDA